MTPQFIKNARGKRDDHEIRSVLRGWAFNTDKRPFATEDAKAVMNWCSRHSLPVSAAADPEVLRGLVRAAVSTWLAAGVDPATVARWAGHSVSVLLEIYAACLHGQDVVARQRVDEFFGYRGTP